MSDLIPSQFLIEKYKQFSVVFVTPITGKINACSMILLLQMMGVNYNLQKYDTGQSSKD